MKSKNKITLGSKLSLAIIALCAHVILSSTGNANTGEHSCLLEPLIQDRLLDPVTFADKYHENIYQSSQAALSLIDVNINQADKRRLDSLLHANAILSTHRFLKLIGNRIMNCQRKPAEHTSVVSFRDIEGDLISLRILNDENNRLYDLAYDSFRLERNMSGNLAWHLKYSGINPTLQGLKRYLMREYGRSTVTAVLKIVE